MKLLKNMTAGQAATSKAIIAGLGLVALGVYVVINGQTEIGIGIILNGFGYIGIRDNSAGGS